MSLVTKSILTRTLSTTTAAASVVQPPASAAYKVQRQPTSNWLPVYRDYQRSHNRVRETIIKRVSGDSSKLLAELTSELKTEGEVNLRSGNLHLKGDHLYAVRDFLTARGF
ncbi:hypothetical protein BDR26DRAFT_1004965 [Obelidium mucronatum]|nr:hypothetical protein BDR26DRAFT_1004965 [Obelidium mucronatum]